jgi:hypothetical protein
MAVEDKTFVICGDQGINEVVQMILGQYQRRYGRSF